MQYHKLVLSWTTFDQKHHFRKKVHLPHVAICWLPSALQVVNISMATTAVLTLWLSFCVWSQGAGVTLHTSHSSRHTLEVSSAPEWERLRQTACSDLGDDTCSHTRILDQDGGELCSHVVSGDRLTAHAVRSDVRLFCGQSPPRPIESLEFGFMLGCDSAGCVHGKKGSFQYHPDESPYDAAAKFCEIAQTSVESCDRLLQVVEDAALKRAHQHQSSSATPEGFVWKRLLPKRPPILLDRRVVESQGSYLRGAGIAGTDGFLVNDRPLLQAVYDEIESAAKRSPHIPPAVWLVDVGANTGSFALLPTLLPWLQVVAFEPVPVAFEVLTRNVRINQIVDNVVVHNLAVSHSHAGSSATMYLHPGISGESTLGSNMKTTDKTNFTVNLISLDAALVALPRLDVLKIDVEGWEMHVIRGARVLIQKHRPVILLERSELLMSRCNISGRELDAELALIGYECIEAQVRGNFWCKPKAA